VQHRKSEYHKTKSAIMSEIEHIYHKHNGVIGYRSMRVFLERKQIFLSYATVHKYMNKEMNLHCICRHRRPGYRKCKANKIFPNLLKQKFTIDKPNKVWCTDFTYIHLSSGVVRYNCAIIDLYDRSIVASETGKNITSELAIKTLEKALKSQKSVVENLILHSDQGSQFTSYEFTEYCLKHGIVQSMSRAGCPYDNAPMERYYNTLKAELIDLFSFETDEDLNYAISEFCYNWYNQIRPHSFNNYLTPLEARHNFFAF